MRLSAHLGERLSGIQRRTWWIIAIVVVIAAGFAIYAATRPLDFRVYHYGARGFFDGTRPMYGPSSGIGWPMHYRYPPLFLMLFAPFAALPLQVSAALWVILKVIVLAALGRALIRRLRLEHQPAAWLVAACIAGPYVIEEFRYGNAQFFVFALTATALLIITARPILAAMLLALAVSLKVWPLFFLPYLFVRGQRKAVAWVLLGVLVLTLLPAGFLGFGENLRLLGEWGRQEFFTQLGAEELWLPNQSLRGILMRYLTRLDYTKVSDTKYPLVHVVETDPEVVRFLWLGLAGLAYAGLLALAACRKGSCDEVDHGIAFCALGLLAPITLKFALVMLIWPAMIAGMLAVRESTPAWIRRWICALCALALLQPLIPGAAAQRLAHALGMDFVITVLLVLPLVFLRRPAATSSSPPVQASTVC